MLRDKPARPGETAIVLPDRHDAGLHFIGHVSSPWAAPRDCPKSSRNRSDVEARLVLRRDFALGLKDIALYSHLIVLYWLHLARRDLIAQVPSHLQEPRGVFALRSPVRPNPIGLAVVELVRIEKHDLVIKNIDCVDGTPLIDIKPYYPNLDSEPNARRPP